MTDREHEYKRELRARVYLLENIVNQLENNQGWIDLVGMLKDSVKQIDGSWHLKNVYDAAGMADFQEARVTKMAYDYLINAMDVIKSEKEQLKQTIHELENPKEYQNAYVDQE